MINEFPGGTANVNVSMTDLAETIGMNNLTSANYNNPSTILTNGTGGVIDSVNSTVTVTPGNGSGEKLNQSSHEQATLEYLAQLLKDKKNLASFPNIFLHAERLIDEEVAKVRSTLFHLENWSKEDLVLPDAQGNVITLQEKLYVPIKEHPDFNFVGRILGPRGMTAKQLEQDTGCKIMIRGRGSMRDKKKEETNRGKPNWEHLSDDLHVVVQCEDTENRALIKLNKALEEVKKLLVPAPEGEDDLKRKQLMELAIINGTYRPANQPKNGLQTPAQILGTSNPLALAAAAAAQQILTRPTSTALGGAPLFLSPTSGPSLGTPSPVGTLARFSTPLQSVSAGPSAAAAAAAAAAQLLPNGVTPAMQQAIDFSGTGLLFPFDPLLSLSTATYPFTSVSANLANPQLFTGDYGAYESQSGAVLNHQRFLAQYRSHPYQRSGTSGSII